MRCSVTGRNASGAHGWGGGVDAAFIEATSARPAMHRGTRERGKRDMRCGDDETYRTPLPEAMVCAVMKTNDMTRPGLIEWRAQLQLGFRAKAISRARPS